MKKYFYFCLVIAFCFLCSKATEEAAPAEDSVVVVDTVVDTAAVDTTVVAQ